MRIIARSTLSRFADSLEGRKDHDAVKRTLDAWFYEVKRARWKQSSDVKQSYATASIVAADRVVFNIKGNAYRMVVSVDFEKSIVWIEWLGNHKDYDRIDVNKVTYERPSQADKN